MELYHGSDVIVDKPVLIPQLRTLDFGRGFYTTANREQAAAFARKVAERRESDKGFISVYEVAPLKVLRRELDFLEFMSPDHNWLDFIFHNRSGAYSGKSYDIVYGPVANDSVYRTFVAYEDGILSKDETIERLKVVKLYNQMTFSTDKALSYLTYKENYQV